MISGSIFISFLVHWESSATTEEQAESQREPAELLSIVRNLLNQTMAEYNKQNFTGAADLADVAYIDNFEFLEAPLERQNETLMEVTEVMLREDLGRLIDQRAQPQQLQELSNEIKQRLAQAEQLLVSNSRHVRDQTSNPLF